MNSDPIRIAVAGAGVFGRNHMRVIRESGEAVLAGVYDTDRARAEQAAAEFGCTAFASLEELAGDSAAAVVAAPTTAHAEVACHLMESGLDVLVEKPIAASRQEAARLVETARGRGRILQVGHLERFNPAVETAASLVTCPLFFEIHRLSVFTPRSLDVDVVADLMIHDLDILLSMTKAMPSEVRAAGISVLSPKVDIANVRLEFPGGTVANLTASRVSTERVRKLRFFQPGQYVSVDYAKQECFSIKVGPDRQFQLGAPPTVKQEPLKRQLEGFVQSVRTRSQPRVDGEAASRALDVAQTIMEKITEHSKVVAKTLASASI
jgi:predicted dehydrogenase